MAKILKDLTSRNPLPNRISKNEFITIVTITFCRKIRRRRSCVDANEMSEKNIIM